MEIYVFPQHPSTSLKNSRTPTIWWCSVWAIARSYVLSWRWPDEPKKNRKPEKSRSIIDEHKKEHKTRIWELIFSFSSPWFSSIVLRTCTHFWDGRDTATIMIYDYVYIISQRFVATARVIFCCQWRIRSPERRSNVKARLGPKSVSGVQCCNHQGMWGFSLAGIFVAFLRSKCLANEATNFLKTDLRCSWIHSGFRIPNCKNTRDAFVIHEGYTSRSCNLPIHETFVEWTPTMCVCMSSHILGCFGTLSDFK